MQCLLAQGASNTLCLKNVMIYFLNKTKEIEPHLYLYIPYTHKINKYDNTKTMGKSLSDVNSKFLLHLPLVEVNTHWSVRQSVENESKY